MEYPHKYSWYSNKGLRYYIGVNWLDMLHLKAATSIWWFVQALNTALTQIPCILQTKQSQSMVLEPTFLFK